MSEKIQKLFVIDNLFFNKIPTAKLLLKSLLDSIGAEQLIPILENSEIIYINNNDTTFDDKFTEKKIKIVNSISEINFLNYDIVVYSNVPFFSLASVFSDIVTNDELSKNTILTQEGYNLSPLINIADKRFLFVNGKPLQTCNISSVNLFTFKPDGSENLYTFKTQKDLVQFLHEKNPSVTLNFYNLAGIPSFSLFNTEIEYIDFCLSKEKQSEGTVGTYAIYFPEDIPLDDMQKLVVELLDNNKDMTIDIRTPHDITKIFEEEIEEVEGEFIVKSNFTGDISRLITTNKDLVHYDYNLINGVIDLSDKHIRHSIMGTPKYMKVYNSEYSPLYRIGKTDLQNAKRIAVKRTMGMGDALLTIPIINMLKNEYSHLEIDFHSKYDFRPYLKNKEIISNFIELDDKGIFQDIDDAKYDIILDFDLAYENQTNGRRFFDYYLSVFDEGALPDCNITDLLEVDTRDRIDDACVIVAEGSGWGGKEPNIDVFERLAYEMRQKGYKIFEPGINRITNFADKTNPEQDMGEMFAMVSMADCYIGTDSGISHIANMFGKPSFIIGGSADPMKTQYNLSLVYPVGRTDLLCHGCRHFFKGFRTLENGVNTFVAPCHNDKQYECMSTLDIDLLIEDLDNFLIKYDLVKKIEKGIDKE